jgi:hypothetical protein
VTSSGEMGAKYLIAGIIPLRKITGSLQYESGI